MLNPVDTMSLIDTVLGEMEVRLHASGWDSPEAKDMILLTFMKESGWRQLRQKTKGGGIGMARGLGQIEPPTAVSLLTKTARAGISDYRKRFRHAIEWVTGADPVRLVDDPDYLDLQLQSNLALSVMLARMKYRNIPHPFPRRSNFGTPDEYILALGHYWNDYYNTNDEHGTPDEFLVDSKYLRRKGGRLQGEG